MGMGQVREKIRRLGKPRSVSDGAIRVHLGHDPKGIALQQIWCIGVEQAGQHLSRHGPHGFIGMTTGGN